tara:strand:- start:30 stop:158 length:129 start_codon:yes stop_codon:yes gene_type:complete
MPKKQTYKQMMAEILKSKDKSKENTKIKESTGGGNFIKVIKI